jgi:hypothetical protein
MSDAYNGNPALRDQVLDPRAAAADTWPDALMLGNVPHDGGKEHQGNRASREPVRPAYSAAPQPVSPTKIELADAGNAEDHIVENTDINSATRQGSHRGGSVKTDTAPLVTVALEAGTIARHVTLGKGEETFPAHKIAGLTPPSGSGSTVPTPGDQRWKNGDGTERSHLTQTQGLVAAQSSDMPSHQVFADPLLYRIIVNDKMLLTGCMTANPVFMPRDIYVHAFNMATRAGHNVPKTIIRNAVLNHGGFRVVQWGTWKSDGKLIPLWKLSDMRKVMHEAQQQGAKIVEATLNISVQFPPSFVFPPAWISPLHRLDTSSSTELSVDSVLNKGGKRRRWCCLVS